MPPSILVEHELPPPPRLPWRRGQPRVIELECIDCYGPLQVTQVMADGTSTHLGEGSDPRVLRDGTIVYIDDDYSAPRELVRVAPDGSVTRTPGGAGRLPGFGGPQWFSRAPFSPDGRSQVRLVGQCVYESGPCRVGLFVDDAMGEREPTRSLQAGVDDSRPRMAVRADGGAFATCLQHDPTASRFIWMDTATGEQTETVVPGECWFIDMEHERVVVVDELEVTVIDRQGGRVVLRASSPPERVLLGPCGANVFLVAGRPDAKMVERINLATGEVTLLATLPIARPTGASMPEDVDEFELDQNGWLLVTTTTMSGPDTKRAWLVRTHGVPQHIEVPVPSAGRTFGVHLGPLAPVRR